MKKETLNITNRELFTRLGDLLLGYDYKPQGDLLLRYAQYFDPLDPKTAQDDARHVLAMFGGWGGLVDIILADDNGPNIEDNRLFDIFRNELYERMNKIATTPFTT